MAWSERDGAESFEGSYMYELNDPLGKVDPLGLSASEANRFWQCLTRCVNTFTIYPGDPGRTRDCPVIPRDVRYYLIASGCYFCILSGYTDWPACVFCVAGVGYQGGLTIGCLAVCFSDPTAY